MYNEKPLITMIIPVYNSRKYIADCIESVLKQTYQNFQLILIDDGATDGSGKICDHYAQEDKRIEVIHKNNAGVSEAKNTGLAHAKGEYIKLMDHDDYLHPQALELCMNLAEQTGADIIQHSWVYMREDTKKPFVAPIGQSRHWMLDRGEAILQIEPATYKKELGERSTLASVVLWSKLFKRHIFDGVRFDPSVKIHEDQRIVHRLLSRAINGVAYTDTVLYFFRETPESLSRKSRKWDRLEIIDCYFDRLDCVMGLPDTVRQGHALMYNTYRRYFINIIKNYRRIALELSGEQEYSFYQRELVIKFKENREKYRMKESIKDKLIFNLFERCPWIFEMGHAQ